MRTMYIKRIYQEDCTIGLLTFGAFRCFTLELPWRDNSRNTSCIPKGLYPCEKTTSPKFGPCIAVESIKNRSLIRIHRGNYTSQIRGCILVGETLADINKDGIPDVTNSTKTLETLLEQLPEEFLLDIS